MSARCHFVAQLTVALAAEGAGVGAEGVGDAAVEVGDGDDVAEGLEVGVAAEGSPRATGAGIVSSQTTARARMMGMRRESMIRGRIAATSCLASSTRHVCAKPRGLFTVRLGHRYPFPFRVRGVNPWQSSTTSTSGPRAWANCSSSFKRATSEAMVCR